MEFFHPLTHFPQAAWMERENRDSLGLQVVDPNRPAAIDAK